MNKIEIETEEASRGRWHVVTVNARRETWAMQNLRANGHEVFYPTLRRVMPSFVQRRGRRQRLGETVVTGPLFPGYLFVRVKAATEWPSIFTTHGVRSVVSSAQRGSPAPVRVGEVEALKAAEVAGLNELMSLDELNARIAALREGDPVKVAMGGSLDFLQAVYAGPVDDERVAVLISICGCDSRVPISKARVSA